MSNNTTLKELYININKLYNNAINILTAINQSFHTSSSEINVTYVDSDDISQSIRIPSFLYLENRIEQLDSNFDNLFNMPKTGEAWFSNSDDMYKLELVKSNTAPVKPVLNTENLLAYVKDSNIFKDLVNPKTYLKVDISNLPDNIEKMLVKKIVFFDPVVFENIRQANATSYDEYKALLYNLNRGSDYEEYDSVIDLPVKEDDFISNFSIETVDDSYEDIDSTNKVYKVTVDTITYTKEDDSSVEYVLQKGQYLCLDNEYVVYQIKDINITQLSNELILEEVIGHMTLQTFEENQNMILHLYNHNYSKFHYIELPLEENQFVAFFLSTLYNNVKSAYSEPIILNLDEISMIDKDGNKIIENGKEVSYIEYYNRYCQNIGDMLLGFSNAAYSQISNYTVDQLYELQNGDAIQNYVSGTVSLDNLRVQRINTHLIDDEYSSKIINLHSKRNELSNNIDNIQSNIDNIYNQLVNTNFETDSTVSQLALKSKLDELYNEKMIEQKQLISVIDNINVLKTNVYGTAAAKYRIRGNASITELENYLNTFYYRCNVIQMEVQYKYKSIGSDTTSVANINSSLFTDWNKLVTIERERKLVFENNSCYLNFENYDDLTNIIKWNQIEIPINQGEDVILRVRYKYSIGQPFVNLYTPWSEELTVVFPQEYTDTLELSTIVDQNDDDAISARFMKTLINDGYTEHVNNKIIDNSQVYFHMPENIYSGFNTPENSFISLKDKLQSMCNDIDVYKEAIQSDTESTYSLYLSLDNNNIQLFPNKNNTMVVSDNEGKDTFTIKNMQLIIKNTGVVPLKLYSLFPGNSEKHLIDFDNITEQAYNSRVYENVPILVEGESYVGQTAFETVSYQTLGQFLYFRRNSTFTTDSYYANNYTSVMAVGRELYDIYSHSAGHKIDEDIKTFRTKNLLLEKFSDYIATNKQMNLLSRYRSEPLNIEDTNKININVLNATYSNGIYSFSVNSGLNDKLINLENFTQYANGMLEEFDFTNYIRAKAKDETSKLDNRFVFRYEHIFGTYVNAEENTEEGENEYIQLSNEYSFKTLLNDETKSNTIYKFTRNSNDKKEAIKISDMNGGFFIPTLVAQSDILCTDDNNSSITINVGQSVSIPLLFEYYLDGTSSNGKSVSKTLSFDIKKSLFKSPENFTITVTAKYNTQQIKDKYVNPNNFIVDSVENY